SEGGTLRFARDPRCGTYGRRFAPTSPGRSGIAEQGYGALRGALPFVGDREAGRESWPKKTGEKAGQILHRINVGAGPMEIKRRDFLCKLSGATVLAASGTLCGPQAGTNSAHEAIGS